MKARVLLAGALLAFAAGASAYGELEVIAPDATGKLPEARNPSKITVAMADPAKLGAARRLAVVTSGDFATRQIRALQLFDEVMSVEDAERLVIARDLTDKVLTLKDPVGQYMFARHLQPYLLVTSHRQVRKKPGAMKWLISDEYEQFIELRVTDPLTTKVLFSAEIEEDMRWKGVSEKNTYYPLLNRLVDWVIASEGPLPKGAPPAPTLPMDVGAPPPPPPPAPPEPTAPAKVDT